MISIIKKKTHYEFKDLNSLEIIAAFSDRQVNLGFKNNPAFSDKRKVFLQELAINPLDLICLKQVHSNTVIRVGEEWRGFGAKDYTSAISDTDGLITDIRNLPLAIFIADCLAMYFFDKQKNTIGLIHSGWQGTAGKIAINTIKAFQQHFSSDVNDIIVAFSPCIRSCCYEVKEDVAKFFNSSLIYRQGKVFLDLAGENKKQLLSAGIKEENIIDCQICTCCNSSEFFSFRREGEKAGRMMAVMMLKRGQNVQGINNLLF